MVKNCSAQHLATKTALTKGLIPAILSIIVPVFGTLLALYACLACVRCLYDAYKRSTGPPQPFLRAEYVTNNPPKPKTVNQTMSNGQVTHHQSQMRPVHNQNYAANTTGLGDRLGSNPNGYLPTAVNHTAPQANNSQTPFFAWRSFNHQDYERMQDSPYQMENWREDQHQHQNSRVAPILPQYGALSVAPNEHQSAMSNNYQASLYNQPTNNFSNIPVIRVMNHDEKSHHMNPVFAQTHNEPFYAEMHPQNSHPIKWP